MKNKKGWPRSRYITNALRKVWRWCPERKAVKFGTKVCCQCRRRLKPENVKVDHITPVGRVPVEFVGWDGYLSRLFCSVSNLQGLCKICHDKKSEIERQKRKLARKSTDA